MVVVLAPQGCSEGEEENVVEEASKDLRRGAPRLGDALDSPDEAKITDVQLG